MAAERSSISPVSSAHRMGSTVDLRWGSKAAYLESNVLDTCTHAELVGTGLCILQSTNWQTWVVKQGPVGDIHLIESANVSQ